MSICWRYDRKRSCKGCRKTEMTKDVTAGKILVTAFLYFKTYKKFAEELV